MVRPSRLPTLRAAAASAAGSSSVAAAGRRSVLLLGIAALGSVQPPCAPASASLGPSSGAVLSNPPLSDLSLESWLRLDPQKQGQRAKVLTPERTRTLIRELENLLGIDMEEESAPPATGLREELQKKGVAKDQARELQRVLGERDKLLSGLSAQPPWIVYGAACVGAFGSTTVMHPVRRRAVVEPARPIRSSIFQTAPPVTVHAHACPS